MKTLLFILFTGAFALASTSCSKNGEDSNPPDTHPGTKTVTVASQQGTLTSGTAGNATFNVTTANIADSKNGTVQWHTSAGGAAIASPPAGVTPSVSATANDKATVTMTATAAVVSGSYFFSITIDGATSTVVTLTVLSPPAAEVIRITPAADMELLRTNPAGKFVITNDIALNGQWTPISNFTGILDGQNHKIMGLNVSRSSAAAMFLRMDGDGQIKNLTIENGQVHSSGNGNVGMLVAHINSGTVENVHVSGGSVTNSYHYSKGGGIAGQINRATIRNCTVSASVKAGEEAGGIAASSSGDVILTGCVTSGNVTGGRSAAGNSNNTACGGIIGLVSGGVATISGCAVSGRVSGAAFAGGIIGRVMSGGTASASISKCFSTGEVSCARSAGGIAGLAANTAVDNCYSTGNVYGGTQEVYTDAAGGIVGKVPHAGTTVNNCYAAGANVRGRYSGGILGHSKGAKMTNNISMSSNLGDSFSVKGRILAGGTAASGGLANNYANSVLTWAIDKKDGKDGQGNHVDTYRNQSFYTVNLPTWDFSTVWKWETGMPYPVLR